MNTNTLSHKIITGHINKDIERFKDTFKDDDTFEFRLFNNKDCSIKCGIVYLCPMINKDIINENIILPIMKSDININMENEKIVDFVTHKILNINSIEKSSERHKVIAGILQGSTVILFQGSLEALIVDTKGLQTRGIQEPDGESVIRGSREGFIESIETNIYLIRRKLVSSQLKFTYRELGTGTKTKICICYLADLVSKPILKELNKRLQSIKIDGVFESGYIEELIRDHPVSPFSTVGNTERPDVVAAKLLEGRIAILCDGTPFVLTIPFLFLEELQSSEDYNNNFIYGSLIRIMRLLGFFLSTSIPGIYLALLTYHHEMIPTRLLLSIASSREAVPLPTLVEVMLMLFLFEALKEASSRLPKTIGQTVGIIGALVLGEAAVKADIVSPSMVIVVATTGICSYLIPKMSISMLITRLIFLISASVLGLYGYLLAAICVSFYLTSMKSFGVCYMSKFIKIDKESLFDTSIRCPWWLTQNKPRFLIHKLLDKK